MTPILNSQGSIPGGGPGLEHFQGPGRFLSLTTTTSWLDDPEFYTVRTDTCLFAFFQGMKLGWALIQLSKSPNLPDRVLCLQEPAGPTLPHG